MSKRKTGIEQVDDRKPHAFLDLPSRHQKALKIERFLDLPKRSQAVRLLEIGAGSGGICHYFATQKSRRYFDIVISNHVIERVGNRRAQSHHLSEICRFLKVDGVGYLSVPNRWMLREPYYNLMFLSWLPRVVRNYYLWLFRQVDFYDCEPLTKSELEELLAKNRFVYRNICTRAFKEILAIEQSQGPLINVLGKFPDWILDWLSPLIPTLIYQNEKCLDRDDSAADQEPYNINSG